MKQVNIAAKLMKTPIHKDEPDYIEFLDLPYYWDGTMSKMREDLESAVFANITFLSSLNIYEFKAAEIPAIYVLYVSAMTLFECLTIGEFTNKFIVTDYDPESYKYNVNCISSSDYNRIIDILREKHKTSLCWWDIPLSNAAIDVLKNCNSNGILFGFFFKLMAMSARMAATSGRTNVYNDYRVNNDLHDLFFGFASYYHGTPINQCNAFAYVYATGEAIEMTKPYEEYMRDIDRGDLSFLGITVQTPDYLWKKNGIDSPMKQKQQYSAQHTLPIPYQLNTPIPSKPYTSMPKAHIANWPEFNLPF